MGLKLKLLQEPIEDLQSNHRASLWLSEGDIVMLTQQRRYLNPTRNSFTSYALRTASCVKGKWSLAVCTFVLASKELVHSLADHFQAQVNKQNNLNVNYLKFPKKHCSPLKIRSRPRPACFKHWLRACLFTEVVCFRYWPLGNGIDNK